MKSRFPKRDLNISKIRDNEEGHMKPHASDRSGLRNKTVFFALVTGCFMLFSGHALALDVIDHFDGDSLNKTIWEASTKRGDGHLNQKQGHLEYTVMDPTAEDSFKSLLRARGALQCQLGGKDRLVQQHQSLPD